MRTQAGVRLADLTTLRVGGPAAAYVEVDTEADLVAAVRAADAADAAGTPALVLGGGSNLLIADEGYAGTVVAVRTRGVQVTRDSCAGVWLEVAAGEPWDDLVARAVAEGWVGIEALSGIPGLTGATPIQNVGAYGQQVSDVLARVRTYDRVSGERRTFAVGDCALGYRTSRFKAEPGRYVVLGVEFQLAAGSTSTPVRYAELARALGIGIGDRAPMVDVRAAVLALRGSKGMVLDAGDHDTWSAGSFFTNPIVAPERVPDGAPAFPQPDGTVKASAAWLIEHAGFARGFALPGSGAAVSGKHTLALTNRGGACAAEIVALARALRAGVEDAYGIRLEPEPTLVDLTLG